MPFREFSGCLHEMTAVSSDENLSSMQKQTGGLFIMPLTGTILASLVIKAILGAGAKQSVVSFLKDAARSHSRVGALRD
jgi:hypothetical protein